MRSVIITSHTLPGFLQTLVLNWQSHSISHCKNRSPSIWLIYSFQLASEYTLCEAKITHKGWIGSNVLCGALSAAWQHGFICCRPRDWWSFADIFVVFLGSCDLVSFELAKSYRVATSPTFCALLLITDIKRVSTWATLSSATTELQTVPQCQFALLKALMW